MTETPKLSKKALRAQNTALKQELDRVCSRRSDDQAAYQKQAKLNQIQIDRLSKRLRELELNDWKAHRYNALKKATDPLYGKVVLAQNWHLLHWSNGLTMSEIVIEGVERLSVRCKTTENERRQLLDEKTTLERRNSDLLAQRDKIAAMHNELYDQLIEVTATADRLQTERDEAALEYCKLHDEHELLLERVQQLELELDQAQRLRVAAEDRGTVNGTRALQAETRASKVIAICVAVWLSAALAWLYFASL